MQWPWSWWTRAWTCGSRRPESPRAPPAHRTAPLTALCLTVVIRRGKYFLSNSKSKFKLILSTKLAGFFFLSYQGSLKAPVRHHEVPDNLPSFLWMWVRTSVCRLRNNLIDCSCSLWQHSSVLCRACILPSSVHSPYPPFCSGQHDYSWPRGALWCPGGPLAWGLEQVPPGPLCKTHTLKQQAITCTFVLIRCSIKLLF